MVFWGSRDLAWDGDALGSQGINQIGINLAGNLGGERLDIHRIVAFRGEGYVFICQGAGQKFVFVGEDDLFDIVVVAVNG